jgi:predicted RNase H-like nuclease (RuvC/YqgF family)
MTKEELEKEAEEWLNKWELCNKCENKVDCISNFSYCKKVVLQSYLASAEPREKRIEELEAENERLTVSYETLKLHDEEEIGMLKSENAELKARLNEQSERITELTQELDDKINRFG